MKENANNDQKVRHFFSQTSKTELQVWAEHVFLSIFQPFPASIWRGHSGVNESSSRWEWRALQGIICWYWAVGFSSFWSMSMSASCIAKLVIIVLGGQWVLSEKVEERRKWRGYKVGKDKRTGLKWTTRVCLKTAWNSREIFDDLERWQQKLFNHCILSNWMQFSMWKKGRKKLSQLHLCRQTDSSPYCLNGVTCCQKDVWPKEQCLTFG